MSEKDDVVELDLRDEIANAFKDSNAKTDEVDNTTVIDKLEKPADKVEKDAEAEAPPETTEVLDKKQPPAKEEPEKEEVSLNNEKAPSSWSPAVREKWGALPQDVRAEIIRREEASINGVRKLHDEYAPIRNFTEALSPFITEAASNGADPAQYIANVLAGERGLRNPVPEQRFNALLNIAEQYGIPLRQIINQQVGQELLQPQQPQQPNLAVEAQLREMQQLKQEMQESAFKREIDAFKAGHEFFEDVSDIMADLMDSGRAKGLDDAYEQACWVAPTVRQVLIDREKSGTTQTALKQRQAAAAGATVKASGAADIKVDTDDDDSIQATVRRAITEASGRV